MASHVTRDEVASICDWSADAVGCHVEWTSLRNWLRPALALASHPSVWMACKTQFYRLVRAVYGCHLYLALPKCAKCSGDFAVTIRRIRLVIMRTTPVHLHYKTDDENIGDFVTESGVLWSTKDVAVARKYDDLLDCINQMQSIVNIPSVMLCGTSDDEDDNGVSSRDSWKVASHLLAPLVGISPFTWQYCARFYYRFAKMALVNLQRASVLSNNCLEFVKSALRKLSGYVFSPLVDSDDEYENDEDSVILPVAADDNTTTRIAAVEDAATESTATSSVSTAAVDKNASSTNVAKDSVTSPPPKPKGKRSRGGGRKYADADEEYVDAGFVDDDKDDDFLPPSPKKLVTTTAESTAAAVVPLKMHVSLRRSSTSREEIVASYTIHPPYRNVTLTDIVGDSKLPYFQLVRKVHGVSNVIEAAGQQVVYVERFKLSPAGQTHFGGRGYALLELGEVIQLD